jgi:hypothetical protein
MDSEGSIVTSQIRGKYLCSRRGNNAQIPRQNVTRNSLFVTIVIIRSFSAHLHLTRVQYSTEPTSIMTVCVGKQNRTLQSCRPHRISWFIVKERCIILHGSFYESTEGAGIAKSL